MAIDLSKITGNDYLAMPEEEQLKVMTQVYRELFFQDVQGWSRYAFDVVEEAGINDYEAGQSRIEIPIAFVRSCAMMLKQCFMEQHRHELQCLSADTEFACQLAEAIFDRADELSKIAEDVVTLQGYYHAALLHRKENKANLVDAEGNTCLYSAETIAREEQLKLQAEEEWKQGLRAERASLERVYQGLEEPAPIEEGYDSCQLPLPLWTAGYAVV